MCQHSVAFGLLCVVILSPTSFRAAWSHYANDLCSWAVPRRQRHPSVNFTAGLKQSALLLFLRFLRLRFGKIYNRIWKFRRRFPATTCGNFSMSVLKTFIISVERSAAAGW